MILPRKKVLFLIPSLTGGGAERVFSVLLTRLDRSRFDLHLAVLEAKGEYMSDVPTDVVTHDLKTPRVRYSIMRIVRLVWRLRPQTVLSTLGHMNLALLLCRPLLPRGTRILVREAAVASAALEGETGHPTLYKWLYRRFYRRADAVICLTDSMVDDLAQNFDVPRDKLIRIYNPIDAERVRGLGAISKNPYAGDGPHLVAVGRLTRQKGFDVLLRAMPAVLRQFPSARLTVLGQGPLREELAKQTEQLGLTEVVEFLGFQKRPWPFLRHADLFVLPSRYEGTPNVLLEALALGRPIVACDCPGALQEIQALGGELVLVPQENAEALAQAIVSVFHSLPKHNGLPDATPSCLKKFEVLQVVGEYSSLL